jgi:hypothetical protein
LIDLKYKDPHHQYLLVNTSGSTIAVATDDDILSEPVGKQETSDKQE